MTERTERIGKRTEGAPLSPRPKSCRGETFARQKWRAFLWQPRRRRRRRRRRSGGGLSPSFCLPFWRTLLAPPRSRCGLADLTSRGNTYCSRAFFDERTKNIREIPEGRNEIRFGSTEGRGKMRGTFRRHSSSALWEVWKRRGEETGTTTMQPSFKPQNFQISQRTFPCSFRNGRT